jgi:hypothetical protein
MVEIDLEPTQVALFIVVELVMFPFGCGVMLDLSTLVFFPDVTVESRVVFFLYAPITAAFYHWLIGEGHNPVSSESTQLSAVGCRYYVHVPVCHSPCNLQGYSPPRLHVVYQRSPRPHLPSHSRYTGSSHTRAVTQTLHECHDVCSRHFVRSRGHGLEPCFRHTVAPSSEMENAVSGLLDVPYSGLLTFWLGNRCPRSQLTCYSYI